MFNGENYFGVKYGFSTSNILRVVVLRPYKSDVLSDVVVGVCDNGTLWVERNQYHMEARSLWRSQVSGTFFVKYLSPRGGSQILFQIGQDGIHFTTAKMHGTRSWTMDYCNQYETTTCPQRLQEYLAVLEVICNA